MGNNLLTNKISPYQMSKTISAICLLLLANCAIAALADWQKCAHFKKSKNPCNDVGSFLYGNCKKNSSAAQKVECACVKAFKGTCSRRRLTTYTGTDAQIRCGMSTEFWNAKCKGTVAPIDVADCPIMKAGMARDCRRRLDRDTGTDAQIQCAMSTRFWNSTCMGTVAPSDVAGCATIKANMARNCR